MSNNSIIKSPYNFVPLSDEVYTPGWANQIANDIPFKDGVSGKIRLRITAETPIFVCDGHAQKAPKSSDTDGKTKGEEAPKECALFSKAPDGRFYIPATSIKGEVRNVLEILSFGRMMVDGSVTFKERKGNKKEDYKRSVGDCLPDLHNDMSRLDLAECIFGYVHDEGMLKGRVQFGHAFSDNAKEGKPVTLTLSSPKASFYPIYIKQDNNIVNFRTYNDGNLSGWKRYVTRNVVTEQQSTDNTDTIITPLQKGAIFNGDIVFHNLRPIELGALLSALTFHNKAECRHQLGQAKPYGYGKVKYEVELIEPQDRGCNHFMAQYEKEMCAFKENWLNCEQVLELITLASIPVIVGDDRFNYMDLKEFQNVKKEKIPFKSFSKQIGTTSVLSSVVQKEKENEAARQVELKRQKRAEELNKLKQDMENRESELCKEKQSSSFSPSAYISLLDKHIKESTALRDKNVDKDFKDIIVEFLCSWEEQRKQVMHEEEEKNRAKTREMIFNDGFEKYLAEPDSIQKCFNRCDSWTSKITKFVDNGRQKLNNDEVAVLTLKLKELYPLVNDKERKEINSEKGKLYKKFKGVMDNTDVKQMFDDITGKAK